MAAADNLDPIDLDDKALAAALEDAHIPSLMLALIHLTGDLSPIRGEIRPKMEFLNPDDGITDEQRAQVRAAAVTALAAQTTQEIPPISSARWPGSSSTRH